MCLSLITYIILYQLPLQRNPEETTLRLKPTPHSATSTGACAVEPLEIWGTQGPAACRKISLAKRCDAQIFEEIILAEEINGCKNPAKNWECTFQVSERAHVDLSPC